MPFCVFVLFSFYTNKSETKLMEMRSNILSTAVRQKKVWGGDGSFNNNNNNSNNNNNNNNSNNNNNNNNNNN